MKLKKCGDKIFVASGLGVENGAEVDIELLEMQGNESIWINGEIYKMFAGRFKLPLSNFNEEHNAIKVYSGGVWYLLEGIQRRGNCLVLSDEYVALKVTESAFETKRLQDLVKDLQRKVKSLEALCSGEDFL